MKQIFKPALFLLLILNLSVLTKPKQQYLLGDLKEFIQRIPGYQAYGNEQTELPYAQRTLSGCQLCKYSLTNYYNLDGARLMHVSDKGCKPDPNCDFYKQSSAQNGQQVLDQSVIDTLLSMLPTACAVVMTAYIILIIKIYFEVHGNLQKLLLPDINDSAVLQNLRRDLNPTYTARAA